PVRKLRRGGRVLQLRANIAGRIAGADRPAPSVATIISLKTCAQRARADQLQPRVDGRPNRKTAVVESLLTILALNLSADFFDEVRGGDELIAGEPIMDDNAFVVGGGGLRLCDVATFDHATEHIIAPL